MAKNVVTGKNEITAKNIIMADNVVVNENEAKGEKKKREFPIVVALIGGAATVIAAGLVALIARGPAPIPPIVFQPNPPLEQAEQLVDEGDYEEALPLLDDAIALDPENPRSYLVKVEVLLHLDRQPEAVQTLDAGAKAVPKPLRKTMRETRTQVKKSPVDGYIGISSTYEKFGLREIAIALLKRVCEELPDEWRLREALGRLIGTIDSEPSASQQNKEVDVVPAELPENVFGMKDVLECGITLDSDINAIADKVGIPRSRIFDYSEYIDSEIPYIFYSRYADHVAGDGQGQICWNWSNDVGRQTRTPGDIMILEDGVSFDCVYRSDFPKLVNYQLVRGIEFGTPGEDVLRSFYNSEDEIIIDNGELVKNPKYSGSDSEFTLYFFPELPGGGYACGSLKKSDNSHGYSLSYVYHLTNINYWVTFVIEDGVVAGMYWAVRRIS